MNWVPVVQASIAGAVFVWGLPVAWQHWSWERRLVARVERNGKVAAASGSPTVEAVLVADSVQLAWKLAAVKEVPSPRGFWVAFLAAWLGVPLQVWGLVRGASPLVSWTMIIVAGLTLIWTNVNMFRLRRLRVRWIELQMRLESLRAEHESLLAERESLLAERESLVAEAGHENAPVALT